MSEQAGAAPGYLANTRDLMCCVQALMRFRVEAFGESGTEFVVYPDRQPGESLRYALEDHGDHGRALRLWLAAADDPAGEHAGIENADGWGTTCVACARLLDYLATETFRAEEAEAALARLRKSSEDIIAARDAALTLLRADLRREPGPDDVVVSRADVLEVCRVVPAPGRLDGTEYAGATEARARLRAAARGEA
ncbi:MAG TPA: hypothetical protein VK586_17670 [Streptosporangiaceae bacterium]|nr:hypothetical protein [Streptosporangiaceae bacterium]